MNKATQASEKSQVLEAAAEALQEAYDNIDRAYDEVYEAISGLNTATGN